MGSTPKSSKISSFQLLLVIMDLVIIKFNMENHLSQLAILQQIIVPDTEIQLLVAIPQQIIVADTEIQLMVDIPQCTGIQLTHLMVVIVTRVMDIKHLGMVSHTATARFLAVLRY